jgi:small-conductance mechanosensitive channel
MFDSQVVYDVAKEILPLLARLGVSLGVFVAFWIGAIAAERVIRRLGAARSIDAELTDLLGRAAKIALVLFGAVTALGTLGINVTALVAGLGLTGFALGFALKDIISNVLAGILVIIYKPFTPGDQITISSFQGVVAKTNLRYTTLEAEGKTIHVPNSLVFSNAVVVAPQEEA